MRGCGRAMNIMNNKGKHQKTGYEIFRAFRNHSYLGKVPIIVDQYLKMSRSQ